ncbi:hypothetical protein RI054_39g144070 [Pseudoscourfieldia marina]
MSSPASAKVDELRKMLDGDDGLTDWASKGSDPLIGLAVEGTDEVLRDALENTQGNVRKERERVLDVRRKLFGNEVILNMMRRAET